MKWFSVPVIACLLVAPSLFGVTIPAGLSRTLKFDFAIESAKAPENGTILYRLVQAGTDVREILIIAKKPGTTELTIERSDHGKALVETVHVAPKDDITAYRAQLQDEAAEGKVVREMTVKGNATLQLERNVGPIYDTNPSILEFARIADEPKRVLLRGVKPGLTDFSVFDDMGQLIAKYYMKVEEAGKPLPRPPPPKQKKRVEFFDFRNLEREPVYK